MTFGSNKMVLFEKRESEYVLLATFGGKQWKRSGPASIFYWFLNISFIEGATGALLAVISNRVSLSHCSTDSQTLSSMLWNFVELYRTLIFFCTPVSLLIFCLMDSISSSAGG